MGQNVTRKYQTLTPPVNMMRVSQAQFHILHLLTLDDDPTDFGWAVFHPPLNATAIRSCEDKKLIEVSHCGMRLTNAGRAAYADRMHG